MRYHTHIGNVMWKCRKVQENDCFKQSIYSVRKFLLNESFILRP